MLGQQTGGEKINQTATFQPHFANNRFMQQSGTLAQFMASA